MRVAGLQVDPIDQINYTKSIKNLILIILNQVMRSIFNIFAFIILLLLLLLLLLEQSLS
jgi:hypothetical protein